MERDNGNENQTLLAVGAVVLTCVATAIWWTWKNGGFGKKNVFRVTEVEQGSYGEREGLLDDEKTLYIFPPSRNAELSKGEAQNLAFTKLIEEKYPERFDNSSWACLSCNIVLSPHGKHYRCGDCDLFVLCLECFETKGSEIHQELMAGKKENELHTDEFIYSTMQFPAEMKRRIFHTFSCPSIVKKTFTFYAERKFIGVKLPNAPLPSSDPSTPSHSSNIALFTHQKGISYRSFHWYSFREVEEFIEHFAVGISAFGAQKFDTIGICCPNGLEWAITDLCCIRKGFTSAAIPHNISKGDAIHILNQTKMKFLVCSSQNLSVLMEVLAEQENRSVEAVLVTDNQTGCYSLPGVHVLQFNFLMQMGKSKKEIEGPLSDCGTFSSNLVAITFTSGSTGCPKAVHFKERNWISQFSHFVAFKTCLLYGVYPMDHVTGRVDLYTALSNGGRIAFPSASEGMDAFFADIADLRPTLFGLIPLLANATRDHIQTSMKELQEKKGGSMTEQEIREQIMTKYRDIFGNRLSSTKVTSAPVSKEMLQFLRDLLQIRVSDGYGSTEAGSISRNDKVTQIVRLSSIPELGYLVSGSPPRGEVFVKQLRMDSYGEEQKEGGKSKEWFATGDIAERIGPHSIRLIDRRSNVIKLSHGEFVAVEKLEQDFIESPLISSIYIYANPLRSHIVSIIIPCSKEITEEEIQAEIQRIAKEKVLRTFQVPTAFKIERELSSWKDVSGLLTSSGKLCRRKLREHYLTDLDRLYLRIAMAGVLDEHMDGSLSFKQQGGTSVDAIRLLKQLKEEKVHISFEELMGDQAIDALESCEKREEKEDAMEQITIDSEVAEIETLFATYASQERSVIPLSNRCYFVTGATGFLGSQLLQGMHKANPDAIFVCLCRNPSSLWKADRVKPLQGDLSLKQFGLSDEAFEEVANAVHFIVHVGFVVNHLVSYRDMYNTNVRCIFDTVKLSLTGEHPFKPIHFTSSVSALTRSPRYGAGYGSSKWAVDHLLKHCKRKYDLPVVIYRPCLISGNRLSGQVNRKDWFHRLLQAISDFRVLPPFENMKEEAMNIVASDYCVEVLLSIMAQQPTEEFEFNITQKNIGWKQIFSYIHAVDPAMKICSTQAEWFQFVSLALKDHPEHPFQPFLTSFEDGFVSPFHSYDNRTTVAQTDIPMLPMTQQDIQLTLDELQKM